MTDVAVTALAKCPYLMSVGLSGCENVTENAIVALVENTASSYLRWTDISYCHTDFRGLKERIESNHDITVTANPL